MVACLTMHHVEEKLLKRIRHMYSKYLIQFTGNRPTNLEIYL